MHSREITSRENPEVKRYVQLAGSRKERRQTGLFVTEGLKMTCEAFSAGCGPAVLFVTEEAWDRYEQLEKFAYQFELFCQISQPVADKLSQSVSPQGVFGIFRMLDNRMQTVKIGKDGRYILLSSMQDPGNIGTILRTAAAFGLDGVFLSSDCPDLYSPKVLRATMGGIFKIPLEVSDDLTEVIDRLQEAGIRVCAAALDGQAVPLQQAGLGNGCAVVIGNEGNGLPGHLIERCGQAVMIPMRPDSQSLNAPMAAGIFLWEMCGRSGYPRNA